MRGYLVAKIAGRDASRPRERARRQERRCLFERTKERRVTRPPELTARVSQFQHTATRQAEAKDLTGS